MQEQGPCTAQAEWNIDNIMVDFLNHFQKHTDQIAISDQLKFNGKPFICVLAKTRSTLIVTWETCRTLVQQFI